MDYPRPCGCKGCRTCLKCEEEYNIRKKDFSNIFKVSQIFLFQFYLIFKPIIFYLEHEFIRILSTVQFNFSWLEL